MNVAKWVILAVLALPILELAAFAAIVATIGFGWALSLILAGSLCGAAILRHAGSGHVTRIRVAMDEGSFAALQTDAKGGLMLLAGILLLIPGFITDMVAWSCWSGHCVMLLSAQRLDRKTASSILLPSNGTRCLTPHCLTIAKNERRH
ncbi:MAG TPA: FxsA family protein [Candidatus Binatia bacterium]|jgi:UPF0716 family protein affecting phage T7 exclusion|nr:FxsA family protein [Candidatus Binatia bacterium]